MEQQITVEQALRMTADKLMAIRIPMTEMENIGYQIRQAVQMISDCAAALERSRMEEEKKIAEAQKNQETNEIELQPISEDELKELMKETEKAEETHGNENA